MATLAVKVDAGTNTNGNPRRGWLVYQGTTYRGFVDEGYSGFRALTLAYPGAIESGPVLTITPGQYRELCKGGR